MKQKCLTGGKMGKFVYLACPTNPLKGPELSTLKLSLGPVIKGIGSPLLISINFDQETEQ